MEEEEEFAEEREFVQPLREVVGRLLVVKRMVVKPAVTMLVGNGHGEERKRRKFTVAVKTGAN